MITEAAIFALASLALVLLLVLVGHRRLKRIDAINAENREIAMSRGYRHYVFMGYDGRDFYARVVD